ncbi:hypothetical protein D3C87_2169310 [compost metagenome]
MSYVFLVTASCAVTKMLMALSPTCRLTGRLPGAVMTVPLTETTAPECVLAGVTAMVETLLPTETV